MTQDFTVLMVCTGNICRSPAMERLWAHMFADAVSAGVQVHSGGTHAHTGEDMQPLMKQRLIAHGAQAEGFVAQQVTAAMVEQADLILTATELQSAYITGEVPAAGDRTFRIRELGGLLQSMDPTAFQQSLGERSSDEGSPGGVSPGEVSTERDRFSALVPQLIQKRSTVPMGGGGPAGRRERNGGGDLDVVDPYMLGHEVYDETFAQIIEPLEGLRAFIRP